MNWQRWKLPPPPRSRTRPSARSTRRLDGAGELAGAFEEVRADVTLSRIGLEQGHQPDADQQGRDRRAMGETPGQAGADRQGGDRVRGGAGLDLVQDPVRRILRSA